MASIFNSLYVGYSGLRAAEVGVNTTSNNIANAESEGYTRKRVVTAASAPLSSAPGNIGNGVDIKDIERIFDNFVFDRYTKVSGDKEYSDFTQTTLEELSTYFPEIDDVGIKADLKEYFNMWQNLADNPDNDAMKLALAKQTETLSESIRTTQQKILDLQSSLNDQLLVNVNEVNSLAKELADINVSIEVAESGEGFTANDLRDKRSVIETSLARLIGGEAIVGQIDSNIRIDSSSNQSSGSYTLSVNGFNIVDGNTFHPINVSSEKNQNGFNEISYKRQDGALIPIDERVVGGKIGAILNLRGSKIEDTTSGIPTNGVLQKVISEMDAFASTLIESTNNIYASSATTKMESSNLSIEENSSILSSSLNVNAGEFDIVIYDIDGNESARKSIKIDQLTSIGGSAGSNSIEAQINSQSDDNNDGNANNDIDDYIDFHWASFGLGSNAMELTMDSAAAAQGFTFAIEDKLTTDEFNSGTNFAGALGLNRFFDGDNASNINLNFKLRENSADISAGAAPGTGDKTLALNMIQQQFEVYNFDAGSIKHESTIFGMFDVIATEVGVETNKAILNNETITAQFNATEMEYFSVSKVSIDEELTNLIKYQTSYGAASKIITTIDQMMQTLLGIKQ